MPVGTAKGELVDLQRRTGIPNFEIEILDIENILRSAGIMPLECGG